MPETPITPRNLKSPQPNKGEELYKRAVKQREERERRIRLEKERAEQERLKDLTFTPKTSDSATPRGSTDVYTASLEWKEKIEKKLQQEREKKEQQELAELSKKAHPSANSEKIVKKIAHVGPVKAWSKHFEEFIEKRQDPLPNREEFKPQINEVSAALAQNGREGPISERLYRDAQEHKERLDQFRKYLDQEMTKTLQHSPRSSGFGHPEDSIRRYDIGTALFLEAQEKEQRIKEKQAQAQAEIPFRPSISERSAKIAETMHNRKPLYVDPYYSSPRGSNSPPEKSPSSLLNTPPAIDNFLKRNQEKLEQIAVRREQTKKQMEEQRMQECTFAPAICKKSVELAHTTDKIYVAPNPNVNLTEIFSKTDGNSEIFKAFCGEERAGQLLKGFVSPKKESDGSERSAFVRGKDQTGAGTPRGGGQRFHEMLYEREMEKWQKKQEEIEKAKSLAVMEELKECTFQPIMVTGTNSLNATRDSLSSPRANANFTASLKQSIQAIKSQSVNPTNSFDPDSALDPHTDSQQITSEVYSHLIELEKFLSTQGVEFSDPSADTQIVLPPPPPSTSAGANSSKPKQKKRPPAISASRRSTSQSTTRTPRESAFDSQPASMVQAPEANKTLSASAKNHSTTKTVKAPTTATGSRRGGKKDAEDLNLATIDSLENEVRKALKEWSFTLGSAK